jgi:tetratricopeptide (TPR) repeat protein
VSTTSASGRHERSGSRVRLLRVVPLAIAWSLCIATRADVVSTTGKPPTIDVRITGFRDGQIEYQLSTQRQASNPIEQVDYLQVTNWPLFNLAEKQQRDGHARMAVSNYERLLKQLTEPKPGELDRRQLVRCRFVRSLDQQGQFDRAVEVYLDIIEQEPGLAERLRPARFPAMGSTFLQAAAKLVDAAIARHGNEEIARSLVRWRNSWPAAETKPTATSGPVTTRPSGATPADVARRVAEIQQWVSSGQFDKALRQIDDLLRTSPGAASAEVFFWQGKALLGRSAGGKAEEVDRDRKRAGLAFMRVVIHFPGNALAPQSLFEAGEICRQTGRREQAASLWAELASAYPTATEWTSRARQELAKLKR